MESTVTVRGQTAIPAAIRRKYNIKPKTKLEWIDDGHTITVLPIPEDSVKALKGRFKDLNLLQALLKSRKEKLFSSIKTLSLRLFQNIQKHWNCHINESRLFYENTYGS